MNKMENKFVPVMVTPYDLKAKIDLNAVSRLIDFYLASGVKGFFANCLSSEMFSISEDERIMLTKHVVDYVKGRVPVVATGSFGLTVEDKADFTKKIYDTGVDAVIMITGHFAKVEDPDDTLLKNFEKIFALTSSIPLGMYECPAPYKRIIPATIFKKLLDSGRLVYHKDTSIDLKLIKAKLAMAKDFSDFEFYDAHTPNAMFSLQMGAKGMSSISGNFYPEVLVWMCNHANDPAKQVDVKWLQSELTRVDPLIHIAYPLSAKYFLQKRGLPVRTISRAQAIQLTPEQRKILDDIYDSFLGWCKRLSIEPVNTNSL
jgi:4-hydroxy-tetrahydrodipicolinate synthase